MTKKEFILQHKSFEEGMICAYKNMMIYAKVCMQAHREETIKKRLEEVANLNKHLWEDD